MASWKKIIVSGSDAELNALSLSGLSNQGSEATAVMINGSGVVGTRELGSNAFTTTTIGTTTNSLTDGNGIADFTFDGSGAASVTLEVNGSTLNLGSSGVKVADAGITATQIATSVAGNGLTGGGGSALAVGAGTGIDVTADAIAVDVSDFMTNGSNNRIVTATGADGMNAEANLTFDGSSLAVNGTVTADGSSGTGYIVTAGGSQYSVAGFANEALIFGFNNYVPIEIGRTSNPITLKGNLTSSHNISSSATITANAFVGDGSGLTGLTSAADGTLTLATSGAINGSATFTANQSGDTTFTVSIDDATTSAKGAASFSSDNFSVSSGAVTIKNGGVALAEMANLAADTIIGRANGAGTGVPTALTATQIRTIINVESGADVTDATNVTAAGALMDTELTSIDDVKGLDQSVSSGATPTFGTANFTDATNKRFMTDLQETKLDSVETSATADQTAVEIIGLLNSDLGGDFTIGNQSSDTATFEGGVIVEGDLTVNGDLTTISTTNTSMKDQFITIASGSTSATDGGIVVSKQADGAGFGLGFDSATSRWAFDNDLAINATGLTPDSYIATVTFDTNAASGNPTYGGASNGYGAIHVETDTGDIFIYA